MLIVLPVSKNDFNKPLNVFGFIKAMRHFGPCHNHELLTVVRPDDVEYGKTVHESVKELFKESNFYIFEENGPTGWPQGPNFYWKSTIQYLKDNDNKLPWFWLELDTIPLKPNWADILEEEYNQVGSLCLGTVQDTTTVTSDQYRIIIAKHLQGTAVYPPRLDQHCSIWEYVEKLPTAFDVICQWEIMPVTKDTKLIQQGFRTLNYKIQQDPYRIQGEDNGDMNGVVSYNDPLNPKAVLHHGCKDTSLANIVTSPEYVYWLKEFCNVRS